MATIKARINWGRWIADCPQCGGAEDVRVGLPFVCKGLVAAGFHGEHTACGFTADVEFPKTADKLMIEALLVRRPVPFRNWFPGETIENLQKENKDRGII